MSELHIHIGTRRERGPQRLLLHLELLSADKGWDGGEDLLQELLLTVGPVALSQPRHRAQMRTVLEDLPKGGGAVVIVEVDNEKGRGFLDDLLGEDCTVR